VDIQFSQCCLREHLFSNLDLWHLWQKSKGYSCVVFFSEFSILFHWSTCLFLCQYHVAFITMDL
jgi:hypothetical protein